MKASALLLAVLAVAGAGCSKPPDSAPDSASGSDKGQEVEVAMKLIDDRGTGADIGSIRLRDGSNGLEIKPDLKDLPPGSHGFHAHQNPDCGAREKDGKMSAGEAAGEHYDPTASAKHAGPMGEGHMGDLPRMEVTPDGKASTAMTAPRLKLADLKNRSLIVHAGDDDFAGSPGGARIACGVVR
ncbi:MAG: superoxide dismutase family protein [Panacagrimonas sp.]